MRNVRPERPIRIPVSLLGRFGQLINFEVRRGNKTRGWSKEATGEILTSEENLPSRMTVFDNSIRGASISPLESFGRYPGSSPLWICYRQRRKVRSGRTRFQPQPGYGHSGFRVEL